LHTPDGRDKLLVMETPIPVNDPAPTGWKPTTSTVVGGVVGGAVAQLITFILAQFGVVLDGATAAAVATLATVAAGYFSSDGGRK
jgi:hypothetical protein